MLFPRVYLCLHVTTTSLNIVTQSLSEALRTATTAGLHTYCHKYRNLQHWTHISKFQNRNFYLKRPSKLTHKNVRFYCSHEIGFQPAVSFYQCSRRIFTVSAYRLHLRNECAEPGNLQKSRCSLPLGKKLQLPVPSAVT